ncbi:anthrone oxygenase family protein [Streptomyces sp. NPDC021020]|uniref:anthrone oxygenase family protein n=1 Tax=Streptomyces sp. NPDC021020 TaxID=3365109 RepID=UPI00378E36E1
MTQTPQMSPGRPGPYTPQTPPAQGAPYTPQTPPAQGARSAPHIPPARALYAPQPSLPPGAAPHAQAAPGPYGPAPQGAAPSPRPDRRPTTRGAAVNGTLSGLVLLAATLTTGLMAGLYFAFSVAVMPGLGRSGDRTLVEAMQRINVAILNGWFTLAFGGALVLGIVAAVLHRGGEGRPALPWIIAGVALYALSLLITMGFSVPLNNTLADAGAPGRIHDIAAVRAHFESAWIHWNIARTLASTAALGCLAWAMRAAAGAGRA